MSGKRYNIAFLALVLLQAGLLLYIVAYRQHWADTGVKVLVKASPVDPRSLMRGDYVRLDYGFTRMKIEPGSGLDGRIHRGGKVYVTLEGDGEGGLYNATGIQGSMPSATIHVVPFMQGRVEYVRKDNEYLFVIEEEGKTRTVTSPWFSGSPSSAIGRKYAFCLRTDTEARSVDEVDMGSSGPFCRGTSIVGTVLDAKVEKTETAYIDYGIDSYFVAEGTGRALERMRDNGGLDVELSLRSDGKAIITAIIANGTRIE